MIKVRKKNKIMTPARVIAIGFLAIIFVGAFLLSLPASHKDGNWFPFIDALFTSTSAVCVTGLSVVDTTTHFSFFGQAVILLLIQIGGLGVMTATTLLFFMMRKRITLKNRLMMQEALSENRLQGVVKSIKTILIMTFVIELIGALILMCSFIPIYGVSYGIWASVFISVSSYCNAGFDILNVVGQGNSISLSAYANNAFVLMPIMALIVIGGLGFMVLTDIGNNIIRKKKHLTSHTKLVLITTAVLILVGWVIMLVTEWNNTLRNLTIPEKFLASLFQSITPRTAGFSISSNERLTPVAFFTTIVLMFVGASPSSTGGGIKTTTIAILIITGIRTMQGEKDVVLRRSKINNSAIKQAITLVLFALILIVTNTILISAFEGNRVTGISMERILFEVTSAFSTVGSSVGVTPLLSVPSKLIMCATMFVGRVGMLTIGFSIAKSKHNINDKIEYTDAKILIG